MTLKEFRAWLDGFQEAIDGAPSEEQWVIILAKFSDVKEPEPKERIVEVPINRNPYGPRWGLTNDPAQPPYKITC